MSTQVLPEGYTVYLWNGRWYASKLEESGMRYELQTSKREDKWFRSEENAAAYCQKHAAKGLSFREEAK